MIEVYGWPFISFGCKCNHYFMTQRNITIKTFSASTSWSCKSNRCRDKNVLTFCPNRDFNYLNRYKEDLSDYRNELLGILHSEKSPYKNMSDDFKIIDSFEENDTTKKKKKSIIFKNSKTVMIVIVIILSLLIGTMKL